MKVQMKKLILVTAMGLVLTACGGTDEAKEAVKNTAEKAVETTKEVAKEIVNTTTDKVAEATGVSTEMAEKAGNMAKSAVDKAGAAVTGAVNTSDSTTGIDQKAEVQKAKKITKAFGGSLKSALKKAMKEGGPINALKICNTEAMPITKRVAEEHGAILSRVSLKNRNPDNVPNAWQKKVLEDFDARFAKGESVKKMAFSEIVENDGKKQLRFMKALPTGGKCLECHGSSIDADVSAKLAELYPEDKATGYEKGQVRGAVVVLTDLD